MNVSVSAAWRAAFPAAHVGLLLLDGVSNLDSNAALDVALLNLESELRERFRGADRATLAAQPTIQAYQAHFRRFGQTYHVLRQLESVALRDKPIASPGGTLVSAMFAAELGSCLLTAAHDADVVQAPLVIDCSREGDRFVSINGQEREIRAGDMLIRDQLGIISAVLYGP